MKISQFQLLSNLQRETLIPVSINRRNLKITLGQILDACSAAIVPFECVQDRPASVVIVDGSDDIEQERVIFDTQDNRFYMAVLNSSPGAGLTIENWTYYRMWDGYGNFFNSAGEVRMDAVFCSADGRFYTFNGDKLNRAGLTEGEASLIKMAQWLEVASEEDMEKLIANGSADDGLVRYIAEED